MKKRVLLAALLVWALALAGQAREVKKYSIEQFLNTTSIAGSSFSHDEKLILFSSNRTGIFNAYTIPVTGGNPTPLTNSTTDSIFALSFFPHDNRILYRSDRGGNEIHHLYVRKEDGTTQELTPGEKARAVFYGWADDDKSFFFGWNRRDPKFMDIYEMEIENFTPSLVYQNDSGYEFNAVSRDKRYLAVSKPTTTNNSDVYLYDRKAESLKHLTPHTGEVNNTAETFSVDSKSLYLITDEGREFSYLKRYDLETGRSETVEAADWDIGFAGLSKTGRYRVMGVNNDGRTEIRLYDTAAKKRVALPALPNGEITSVNISKSEKRMSFYHNGSRSPNNLYVLELESGKHTRLTDNLNPEINPEDLVEAEVVRYPSFDGVVIPAIYYRPQGSSPTQRVPALVWVHGGPGGQSRVGYSAVIQYLVNHGYAVIAVNNRGSSGYGKTFFAMDDLKHGEEDLRDCIEAKKFLAGTGAVDAEKIGILGGSYGGYMVLAALTFQPKAFAVGVDLFGISNWVRTLESIPPWWEAFREALYKEMGNPETDKDYLRRISPLFHSEKIERPLMVLQGANDPRVLKVESDEIVAAARKNKVPVEYLVFDDEGHGFVKKENQIKGYGAMREFLDQYLKGEAAPKAP
ncbi:MAG: alpha/beta fold hydrolase [Candidatus Acidiferrales bacterium]